MALGLIGLVFSASGFFRFQHFFRQRWTGLFRLSVESQVLVPWAACSNLQPQVAAHALFFSRHLFVSVLFGLKYPELI